MLRPKYMLARSIQLSAALSAIVTDAGGVGRAVTIAAINKWIRARLATAAWTGGDATTPYELFTLAANALNAGSGAGTWTIAQIADGRTRVTWSGPGSATLFAGGLTRALGFSGGLILAAGASADSSFPAAGVLLWSFGEEDSGWVPRASGVTVETEAGTVYRRGAAIVTYRRTLRAFWVPRAWSINGAGEYLSPLYSTETAYAGPASAVAPDPIAITTASALSWLDGIYAVSGDVPWGFTDEFAELAADRPVSEAYLAPEVFADPIVTMPAKAVLFAPRRDIQLALGRTGSFEIV